MANVVLEKSQEFGRLIVKTCKKVQKEQHEYVLTKQLLRSGTSIGANVCEAQEAESAADFVHKMSIALKECRETLGWLDKMEAGEYFDTTELAVQCMELKRILTSIVKTTKKNNGWL